MKPISLIVMAVLCSLPATYAADEESILQHYFISGCINHTGDHTFHQGQVVSLGFFIGVCGGLARDADGHHVSVWRTESNLKMTIIVVDAQREIEGRSRTANDFAPWDNVDSPVKNDVRNRRTIAGWRRGRPAARQL
jgi:hypothetical protein